VFGGSNVACINTISNENSESKSSLFGAGIPQGQKANSAEIISAEQILNNDEDEITICVTLDKAILKKQKDIKILLKFK
jgi:hypothetical protein